MYEIDDYDNYVQGEHVTLAVCSNGNPYGVDDDIICGFPVVCENGTWKFAEGISIDEKLRQGIENTSGMFI